MKPTSQVPVALGSILGLVGTAAAGVTSVVQSIEHNEALFTGANKPAAIVAAGVLVATFLGRMFQAAHLTGPATVAGQVVGALPTLEQELAAQPPAGPPPAAPAAQ